MKNNMMAVNFEAEVEVTKENMLAKMQEMNKENKYNTDGKKMAVLLFKNASKQGNKIFLDIPLTSLKVDNTMYQRPVQNHLKKLAMDWQDKKCDPLCVNYRNDGYFYILDGQHRFLAAQMRGLESLVCTVFVGMTVKEEADFFVGQNDGIKKLTPYDTYKANLCRGEAIDCAIKDVCDCYGIKVEKSSTPHTLKSVTAARAIIRSIGKDGLHWIFTVMRESKWDCFKDAYTSQMLMAFYNVYQACINNLPLAKERLVEYCKIVSPKETVALANVHYPTYGDKSKIVMLLNEVVRENNKDNIVNITNTEKIDM